MEVKATTRYTRISALKLRLPIAQVKGKNAEQALTLLKFMPIKAAGIIYKTLQSAISNAEHNNELDVDKLIVKNIIVPISSIKWITRGQGLTILIFF